MSVSEGGGGWTLCCTCGDPVDSLLTVLPHLQLINAVVPCHYNPEE